MSLVEGLNIKPHVVVKSGGRALLREDRVKDIHHELNHWAGVGLSAIFCLSFQNSIRLVHDL